MFQCLWFLFLINDGAHSQVGCMNCCMSESSSTSLRKGKGTEENISFMFFHREKSQTPE
jgi:hypothetical protein